MKTPPKQRGRQPALKFFIQGFITMCAFKQPLTELARAPARSPLQPLAVSPQSARIRGRYDTRARQSSLRSPQVPPAPAPRWPANPKPELSSRKAPKARVLPRGVHQSKYWLPCASFRSRAETGSQILSRLLWTCLPPASLAPCTVPACPLQTPDILVSRHLLHLISWVPARALYSVRSSRQPRPFSAATRSSL